MNDIFSYIDQLLKISCMESNVTLKTDIEIG